MRPRTGRRPEAASDHARLARPPWQNRSVARWALPSAIGSNPLFVWLVKHLVSPVDRLVVRLSRGRLAPPSSVVVPTLLLTTVGRSSGEERTVPLVCLAGVDHFVVANARPAGERRNPWVVNLRANPSAKVRWKGSTFVVLARELEPDEADNWWPDLVAVWPAFGDHYAATRERSVFVLERGDAPG